MLTLGWTIFNFQLSKLSRVFFGVVVASMISGCTTSTLELDAEEVANAETRRVTPNADKIGTGGAVIGIIVADEVDNLSGGLPNSAYLSAKLAAQTLKGAEVTLIVRRYQNTQASLKSAVAAFVESKAGIVIGPHDDAGASALATLLHEKNIPIISLGVGANEATRIYGAGFSLSQEVAIVAKEMKKRKYRSVIIARTKSRSSTSYAEAVQATISGSKIKVVELDISDPAQGLLEINKIADAAKTMPKAILFATGPKLAGAFITAYSTNQKLKKLAVVGNSGWGTANNQNVKSRPFWYVTIKSSHLQEYGRKFTAATKSSPTVRGAIIYDLVVMAGILPKVVPQDPYAVDVLSNSQGFTGQSGKFKFHKNGTVIRGYKVTTIK